MTTFVSSGFLFAAGSAVGVAGKLTHNEYVGVAADVAKEQLEEDKDASAGERLGKLVGTAAKGIGDTDLVGDNEAVKG